jgi:hypothetical protein
MEAPVRIDQSLYGYNDGHRLLMASRALPDEAASTLLIHSDVAAGAAFDQSGYWTGLPLPSAKAYALMRTWPAPEMPRPGCVWTQALIIGAADIARLANMDLLTKLFSKPNSSMDLGRYGKPLMLDTESALGGPSVFSRTDALKLIDSLYARRGLRRVAGRPGHELENALFAVWSQQWPRLRRSFSFQTAGAGEGIGSKFNLRIGDEHTELAAPLEYEDWERLALDDLFQPGEFRKFIWRYGADLRRGLEQFRFLAETFLQLTRLSELSGEALYNILNTVIRELPRSDEGKMLKADLVGAGSPDFTLIPHVNVLDALSYVLRLPDPQSLPVPRLSKHNISESAWQDRADQILQLLELADTKAPKVRSELANHLVSIVNPDNFFFLSKGQPKGRNILLAVHPRLMDSPGLGSIPHRELGELLEYLGSDLDLIGRVVDRLLLVDDQYIAEECIRRHPLIVATRIFNRIVEPSDRIAPSVSPAWMRAIAPTYRRYIPSQILPNVRSTTALAACADLLNLDVAVGLSASPLVWCDAVRRADDDVAGESRQRLMTFLLAMALEKPLRGTELLFEFTFQAVHADIVASRLPNDALNMLSRHLPSLYWWQQWDIGLRLRVAVAQAYFDNALDVESFRRLTTDKELFSQLIAQAKYSTSGRLFLSRIS